MVEVRMKFAEAPKNKGNQPQHLTFWKKWLFACTSVQLRWTCGTEKSLPTLHANEIHLSRFM